jgi:hypothetical protein
MQNKGKATESLQENVFLNTLSPSMSLTNNYNDIIKENHNLQTAFDSYYNNLYSNIPSPSMNTYNNINYSMGYNGYNPSNFNDPRLNTIK